MNTRTFHTLALLTAGVACLVAYASAVAGDRGCSHCGRKCDCEKVCRLIVEEKKVDVVCWGCQCEDFCVPGPSQRGCENCETVCDFCVAAKPGDPAAKPKKFVWYDWTPSCHADVFTRKKLMKKTVTKTVPRYQWVVEDLCPHCERQCMGAAVTPGTEVPAPPLKGVKLKYTQANLLEPVQP